MGMSLKAALRDDDDYATPRWHSGPLYRRQGASEEPTERGEGEVRVKGPAFWIEVTARGVKGHRGLAHAQDLGHGHEIEGGGRRGEVAESWVGEDVRAMEHGLKLMDDSGNTTLIGKVQACKSHRTECSTIKIGRAEVRRQEQ